jgi:hypothetical protein
MDLVDQMRVRQFKFLWCIKVPFWQVRFDFPRITEPRPAELKHTGQGVPKGSHQCLVVFARLVQVSAVRAVAHCNFRRPMQYFTGFLASKNIHKQVCSDPAGAVHSRQCPQRGQNFDEDKVFLFSAENKRTPLSSKAQTPEAVDIVF